MRLSVQLAISQWSGGMPSLSLDNDGLNDESHCKLLPASSNSFYLFRFFLTSAPYPPNFSQVGQITLQIPKFATIWRSPNPGATEGKNA